MTSSLTLPPGDYYALVGNLRPGKGGLTSALLERTRLLNERLGPGRHMPILTFSKAASDDPAHHGLVDGDDVWNIERHGGRPCTKAEWVAWLSELGRAATAQRPVYFVCDGHIVGSTVVGELKAMGIPHLYFIQVVHNPTSSGGYAPFRTVAHLPDAVVCATRRQAQALRRDEKHGGPVRSASVVPIPYPRRAGHPARLRNPDRIVMLARLHPQKDVLLAVESLAVLRRMARRSHGDGRGIVLDVYGALEDPAEVARVEEAVERLGLQDAVTLHGHVSGATAELASSSVLWLTSRHEGWGLVITEAQQAGCIPVAIDVEFGPREQIDHGVDGFLVRATVARRVRHDSASRWRRAVQRAARRVVAPVAMHMAAQTLEVMQMSPRRLGDVRQAGIDRTSAPDRSPETYVDRWIDVFEAVTTAGQRRSSGLPTRDGVRPVKRDKLAS